MPGSPVIRVIALGDAWVVNDPITGQGANLGSRCAFVLADAIVTGPPYDEALCRKVEMEMCEVLGTPEGAAAWLKGFLQGGR